MQSASDKVNSDDPESMFDFLDGEDGKQARQQPQVSDKEAQIAQRRGDRSRSNGRDKSANKPFPVIRKPVSVSRSGPLRPPRPGEPVAPPPSLTDAIGPEPARSRGAAHSDSSHANGSRTNNRQQDLRNLEDLDMDFGSDDWPSSEQWVDKNIRPFPEAPDRGGSGLMRKLGYVVATLLIIAGAGTALYSQPQVQSWADEALAAGTSYLQGNADSPSTVSVSDTAAADVLQPAFDSGDETTSAQNTTPAVTQDAEPAVSANAPQSLGTLFREELARLETLVDQGELADATTILQTMDRAVYGYGAPEFTQIKERIEALEVTASSESESAADTVAQAEAEAARIESVRLERATAAAEQQRLASVQLAQDQSSASSEQVRADRLAQEQARLEQLDVARQERALLEQERLAQQQLAATQSEQQAAAAEAYQPADLQTAGGVAGSTSETVEQLAARQREAARQQRLVNPQGAGQAVGQESVAGENLAQESLALADSVQPTVASVPATIAAPQPITDGDLQRVYGQFSQLQDAIENRDVNAVIELTERSGIRIQQMMQMFENNVSIQTRLRNVSTLDAAGQIQGTLQITRLERADGSITGPPLNLGSVRLSSTRQGNDWSAIRW